MVACCVIRLSAAPFIEPRELQGVGIPEQNKPDAADERCVVM